MRPVYLVVISCLMVIGLCDCGGSSGKSDSNVSNQPELNISDADVLEGDSVTSNLQVSVELNKAAIETVSFNYATSDNSAVAGLDYSSRSGSTSINKGQTSVTLSIPILGDGIPELDESFTITLDSVDNAVIKRDNAQVTIRDDDEASIAALDTRPSNPSCDIPDPPPTSVGIKLTRVFSSLSFDAPILLLQAPGNNNRWYLVEQDGLIKTFETGDSNFTIFTDLSDRAVYTGGQDERGLLGMAFHPDFQTNGEVYLYYIANDGGNRTIVSRYLSPDNGLTLTVPAFNAEDKILELAQPADNHNGGHIGFDGDGYLYIGLGDGGSSNDFFENGLDIQTLLGSMLRIDIDSSPAAGKNYAIPVTNPFVGNAQVLDEIYAYGLRNPWRWSFDRQTGDLYLGDVGQSAREEIDLVEAGAALRLGLL